MSDRPDRLTERRLWAECFGHCMNSSCENDLVATNTVVAELAHIVAAKDGGPPSFDNMLVLCLDCHKIGSSGCCVGTELLERLPIGLRLAG